MSRWKVRVEIPAPLRRLADTGPELSLTVAEPTLAGVVDALEAAYPALHGTVRDPLTQERRPYLRFFACQQDISLQAMDAPLPAAVADGSQPLLIVGAIAGG